jgi:hypothetical protein
LVGSSEELGVTATACLVLFLLLRRCSRIAQVINIKQRRMANSKTHHRLPTLPLEEDSLLTAEPVEADGELELGDSEGVAVELEPGDAEGVAVVGPAELGG